MNLTVKLHADHTLISLLHLYIQIEIKYNHSSGGMVRLEQRGLIPPPWTCWENGGICSDPDQCKAYCITRDYAVMQRNA